jgi:hypothetical protein
MSSYTGKHFEEQTSSVSRVIFMASTSENVPTSATFTSQCSLWNKDSVLSEGTLLISRHVIGVPIVYRTTNPNARLWIGKHQRPRTR